MKQLILIRGLSGSGKTTLAETICGDLDDRFMVSADDFFTDDKGVYTFEVDKLKEAHQWCQKETEDAMNEDFIDGGYDVIVVHNSFTRKWEVDPYMELAKKNDYQVQVINLYDGGLSDRELSERGVHNLPPHQIQKQRKRWEKDVYREPKPRYQPQYHAPYPYQHPPQYQRQPQYQQPYPNQRYQKRDRNW